MNDGARHIWTITKRELSGYFASPVAYVFIVIWLLLNGVLTFLLGGFFEQGQADLANTFFTWHPWLYLFLVPAAGMRLWAEERRLHTMELLLTMPITAWQAIVGKFLASWLFLIIALALTFPVVITVSALGNADGGAIFTGYVGSAMLSGSYLAITCMTSAMSRNQVISFILAVVICFLLILPGIPPVTDFLLSAFPEKVVRLINSFSVYWHFLGFQRGVLDSRDLIFFASVAVFALFSTSVIIRNLRAG
jgi:ABC-2 type transport system permease protein